MVRGWHGRSAIARRGRKRHGESGAVLARRKKTDVNPAGTLTRRALGAVRAIAVTALLVAGCRSSSETVLEVPGHCAAIAGAGLAELIDEYPLELLSDDVREDLEEALRGASRICLVADAESVSCNAGGGPKPDMRRCCRFANEPHAAIFGVARRIGVSRGGTRVVDLAVDPGLTNASIDRRCEVPTCTDDRATATASLTLMGTVEAQGGSIDFELPVTLDRRLTLHCEG